MPIFELNGQRYNVENQYIDAFSKENPDASTIEERNGQQYLVRAKDYRNFLSSFDSDASSGGTTITGGVGTQEEADSLFDLNQRRFNEKDPYNRAALDMEYQNLEKKTKERELQELRDNLETNGEIKRLQGIKDTAQKRIDEAGFFDRFFDADTRAAVAARNAAEEALETYDEAKHADEGWFDRNVMGVFRGIGDKIGDLATWDLGASGAFSGYALKDVSDKLDRGEQLTAAEQNMLDAFGLASAVQTAYQDKVGMAYRAGGSLPESAAFMGSLALNPAAGVGRKIAEKAAKAAVKKYGASMVSKLAKGAARVGGDMAEMAVATAVPGAGRVAEDYYNRLNGQSTFDIDENGIIRYGGQVEQEEADDAIWKAFGSQFIENYSESVGNYFAPMGTMLSNLTSKGLKAAHLGKLADAVNDISSSQFSRGIKRFNDATKFDGYVGEYLEEVAGNFMNAATVGDMNFNSPEDPRSVFNPDVNLETALSCALMSGTIYAVEAPISVYNRRVAKKNLADADKAASELWGDRWTDMRSQMDEADPQLLAQLLTGINNATDLSDEAQQAANNYAIRLMQMQGYNSRRLHNQMESTDEANAINNAYDNGAELSIPYDKHNAKLALDRAESALADDAELGKMVADGVKSPVETINAMAGSGKYSDEQIQKAKDYYTAYHRMKGLTDALLDKVDSQIESANREVDANTNVDENTGVSSIVPVTLRDGRQGYVIQGTITPGEKGSIDVNKSDSYIVVRVDGKNLPMNPNKDLVSVGQITTAESLKEYNNTELKRKLIDEGIGEIDWNLATPNPKVGDSFELQGVPVTIVAHDGKGGMYVVPTEEYQSAVGSEKKMQELIAKAQQSQPIPAKVYKDWASAQLDAQEEAAKVQQEVASGEAVGEEVNVGVNNVNVQPVAEGVASGEELSPVAQKVKSRLENFKNSGASQSVISSSILQEVKAAKSALNKAKKDLEAPIRSGVDATKEMKKRKAVFERAQKMVDEYSSAFEELGLDENAIPFVKTSSNTFDFGMIDEGKGLKSAPIRLSQGFNNVDDKGNNHGYGLEHIEAGHGAQIREAGFESVEDFISAVASNYQTIRKGNKRNGENTYLLEVSDGKNNTLFVELAKDGRYWNVNSAGIFREGYSKNKEVVWSLPAVEQASTAEASEVQDAGRSSKAGNPLSGNSPQTTSSTNKDSENNVQSQEKAQKPLHEREKNDVFRELGETYGEKMPHKVAVTAKAWADKVKKAQKKVDEAQKKLDDAPIGEDAKPKTAVEKAVKELEAIKVQADFWAEMDAEVKAAQQRREEMLNPKVEADMSNEPMTADEFVAQQLAAGNIVLNKDDYMRETGFGSEEANAMNGGTKKLFAKDGMTIQEAGERLMEMDRENGTNFFDQSDSNAGRDALISVLGSVKSRKELNQYIAENRKAMAKKEAEGLRAEMEKAIWDSYHISLEEFVAQMEADELNNPYEGVDLAALDAIFAEKEFESFNEHEYESGRNVEGNQGQSELLSEAQSDNQGTDIGGEEERAADEAGNKPQNDGETAQGGSSGRQVILGEAADNEVESYRHKVRSWLSDENLEAASEMTRDETLEKFGNTPEPVAYIPMKYLAIFGEDVTDNRLYCGKGYFIEHAANHHPEVNVEEYDLLQDVLSNPDAIKHVGNSIAFTKMHKKGFAVLVQLSNERGKIILHKSMFWRDKGMPYKNKQDVEVKPLVGGRFTISPNDNSIAGRLLSALNGNTNIANYIIPQKELDEILSDFSKNEIEISVSDNNIGDEVDVSLQMKEGETTLQFAERAAKENERRIPLRKRVKEWENLLGVRVNVIERPEDVKNGEALRYMARGYTPSGWVEDNGEVCIYLPGTPNVAEVDKTMIHEVVAHKGLPGLLGKARFNELCDKVWDMMPEAKRAEYYEYVGGRFGSEAERQRAAADEYMAFLAEGVDITPQDKSVWKEIVKYIRSVIDSVMGKTDLTDADIEELLRASFARLVTYKQAVDARGGRTMLRMQHKDSDRRQKLKEYNDAMDQATAFVTGWDVKRAKQARVDREQKRKEDAAEIYESVLKGDFNDVTLQKIDKYIEDATPFNSFGRRISQRLPQSLERSLREGARTNAVDALFSRISESAVPASRRASEAGRREIEERKKEALKGWAIATGNWHTDLSEFTDEKEPFAEGTDSKVYASREDGYVIKTSFGKPFGKRFRPDIDNVALFNRVFPNAPYEIIGYGEFDGKFARILKQPVVYFAEKTALNAEEREEYMRTLGFKPINDSNTAFSNGTIIAADLQKSNILKDAAGNVSVIDADMKLHTKDVGGNYTYPPVEADLPEGTRFRVVYHGSGADFDKFDHSKMGTGAGSQVFGWGTYVTESRDVARNYGDVAIKGENPFKYVGDQEVSKYTLMDAEQIMNRAGSYKEMIKRYGSATLAPGTALEKAVTFLKSTKEEDWQGNRHFYEVEIPDEKRGNYIVNGNNVTDSAANKVFDGIFKRISTIEGYDNPTAQKELKRELDDLRSNYGQGKPGIWKDLYGDISYYLGTDKDASLFLRSLGYVGIKYPAGTIYQGDYGNASNYVIFNEKDLKIVEHTRFRMTNKEKEELRESDETKALFDYAKKIFGRTFDLREAGYILPDGAMLDFSGRHEMKPGSDTSFLKGQRSVDHRYVADLNYEPEDDGGEKTAFNTDMADFINRGAIRIDGNAGSINLTMIPTKDQKAILQRMIQRLDGDVWVDFSDGWNTEHSAEYAAVRPFKILADIDKYYNEGIKPEGNARFRIANRNQEIFVSNAERAVEGIKQEKATPQQWLAMIEKNGGLKAGEDKWLGLSDWLKESTAKTLTKNEVLNFIGQNKIRIEEVKYSGAGFTDEWYEDDVPGVVSEVLSAKEGNSFADKALSAFDFEYDDYREVVDCSIVDEELAVELYNENNTHKIELEEGLTSRDRRTISYWMDEIVSNAMKVKKQGDNPINSTRLNYTTEGLENKQEIALTIPTIEPWNEDDDIHFGDAGEGRAVAWIRFGETTTPNVAFINAREAVNSYIAEMREKYNVRGGGIYDVMNEDEVKHLQELTSAEFDTRDKVERVLVIDEIQSKRHQEGREKGYRKNVSELKKELEEAKLNYKKAEEAYKEYYDSLFTTYTVEQYFGLNDPKVRSRIDSLAKDRDEKSARVKSIEDSLNEAEKYPWRGIPSAPFEKNWHELAFKRMLRYAAENGFDKVAWTKGEQQAERYNIGGAVNSIDYFLRGDGIYRVETYGTNGYQIQSVPTEYKDGQALAEVFGKELATKIVKELEEDRIKVENAKKAKKEIREKMRGLDEDSAEYESLVIEFGKHDSAQSKVDEGHSISGDGLRVGGEGMKGFYDRMLPSFVNKYVKKWGTKVQDVELPNVEEAGRIMHSVDVTEAMKESVMEGQTMFRISDKGRKIQQKADEFSAKYNSKEVVLVDSVMTDEELEAAIPGETAEEIREALKAKNVMAGYLPETDKIYIFVDNQPIDDVEGTMFHENAHGMFHNNAIVDAFDKASNDAFKEAREAIAEEYAEKQRAEELFAYVVQKAMANGDFKHIETYLTGEYKEEFYNKLKEFGYDTEEEVGRRNLGRGTGEESQGVRTARSEEQGTSEEVVREERASQRGKGQDVLSGRRDTGRSDGSENGTQGSERHGLARTDGAQGTKETSPREQAEQLEKLFGQVADMGLRGVLGNAEYDMLMFGIFRAIPQKEREEISLNAVKNLNLDVAKAVDDYLKTAENATLWEKVKGLVRDALRKVGFDVELTKGDVKYLLWRSRKPMNRKHALDVAEDMDARSRFGVGEYSPTRFRRVYHGSGASFDKFDHSFMGTGEGVQAFGWGTYVTEVDGIARTYAVNSRRVDVKGRQEAVAADVEKTFGLPKGSVIHADWDVEYENHELKLKSDKETVEAFIGYFKEWPNKWQGLPFNEYDLNDKYDREDFIETAKDSIFSDFRLIGTDQYFKFDASAPKYLYEVEIPDNDGTNYLEWDKPLNEENKKRIKDAVLDSRMFNDYAANYGEEISKKRLDNWLDAVDAGRVYRLLENFADLRDGMESAKAISMLLNDAGFVGIEYLAEAMTGGREDGAKNYVIFNEKDLEVKEHTRFRVAYHGSPADFVNFDISHIGENFNHPQPYGLYFTDSPEHAKSFSYDKGNGKHLYEVELPDEGFFDLTAEQSKEEKKTILDYIEKEYPEEFKKARRNIGVRAGYAGYTILEHLSAQDLMNLGYHGVIAYMYPAYTNANDPKVIRVFDDKVINIKKHYVQKEGEKDWFDKIETRFRVGKKKASKTVLPEDESSFKGSVVSDADRAKVLNNLDILQKEYEEKSAKRRKTFISDLSKALHLRNNGNNSNYADYVSVNGEEVTIRVSDHNASVSDMDNAGKSNGISIVIGRKPNEGIRDSGDSHIVEYYYNNKKLENSEGNPYTEIINSFKQTVYSGEYKDTTGLAERQEVNPTRFRTNVKKGIEVRDDYEAMTKKSGYQAREAIQDAMLSLRRFQELLEKATGKAIRGFENAWWHENRMSSMTQSAIHEMERKFYKPMTEAVKKLMKSANMSEYEVSDYLMLKHGIERNREMAVRKALTSDGQIDRDKLNDWYEEKRRIRNDASLDTWRKKQEAMDDAALMYGADMSRDYSGLTSMFDTDDLADCTERAYKEVEAIENAHPRETEAVGKAVKAMTQSSLDYAHESGLMDKKVYDELTNDMYDYYIPLRGFDETTSDEVYAYMDNDRGAFNAPLRRAKGRSSKADNPLAYMKSIAESGIMQGNRNRMKQSFLAMVMNRPSDLVSVKEGVWAVMNTATGEWEAASVPPIPDNATPADVEAIMTNWDAQMEQRAQQDPDNVRKIMEADDVPYRVIGNRMNQHQVLVKWDGKSYTLTINGNPRLAMALNGLTNPNNTSNDGKVAAAVQKAVNNINRQLAAWYTTRNPDFVASNFMRDTFYTNTIVRAKEGNHYANHFHKHYAKLIMPGRMLGLFNKWENGTLDMNVPIERDFHEFMVNGGETGYSNLKDMEEIKRQISKDLKGKRFENVEKVLEVLDRVNRAVENTARFAAFRTSKQVGRTTERAIFDAKEISVNFNRKGSGGTFFKGVGQTRVGNLAAMVGAGGRALYVFFNAAIQGTANLMHVMKVNLKGTGAGLGAMFLMGAVIPMLFDGDDEKDYYDLPEHVRRNHLIIPSGGDAWISIPLPIEYRIMYGAGELLTSWRTGHEKGRDIGRKMLNLTGQALPLNFLEEGMDAFIPSSLSPLWQVYNNKSWTGLPIYKDNEFNKDDPEYMKAYKNVDRVLYNFSKSLYEWTFDEENQEPGINLNPAVIEHLAKGYFGGLATQLSNLAKTGEMIAGERDFDWRNIPIGNRALKTGDERTKEKRVTNEYFDNLERLEFLQSRERMIRKTINGAAVPEEDKEKAYEDYRKLLESKAYKEYMLFKEKKKLIDKQRKAMKEQGTSDELNRRLNDLMDSANRVVSE